MIGLIIFHVYMNDVVVKLKFDTFLFATNPTECKVISFREGTITVTYKYQTSGAGMVEVMTLKDLGLH